MCVVCMYVCMYVCTYVRMYVRTCVRIFVYTLCIMYIWPRQTPLRPQWTCAAVVGTVAAVATAADE